MNVDESGKLVLLNRDEISQGHLPIDTDKAARFAYGSMFAEVLYDVLPKTDEENAILYLADPANDLSPDQTPKFFTRDISTARDINEVRILLKSTLDYYAEAIGDRIPDEIIESYNRQISAEYDIRNFDIHSGDYRKLMRSAAHTGAFSPINGYHILRKQGVTDPVAIERFLRNPVTKRTLNSFTYSHFEVFAKIEKTVTTKTGGEHWDERFFTLDHGNFSILETVNSANTSNLALLREMVENQVTPQTDTLYCAGLYSKIQLPSGKYTNAVNAIYDWATDWIVKWVQSRK